MDQQHIDLLNSTRDLEKLTRRHPSHQANSRRKHLSVSYLGEATDEALAAYHDHLENVLTINVALQIVGDALNDVELDDTARKQLAKLIKA